MDSFHDGQQMDGRIQQIAVPTLLLHGDDTMPFVTTGCARAVRHNAPHLQLQVTAGGHCFMQQDPADALQLVELGAH